MPSSRSLRKRRRVGEAAEGIRHAEAGVVNQHDEHVGRILRQTVRLDAAFVDGFLQRLARLAGGRRGRKRQHGAVVGRGGIDLGGEAAERGEECVFCFQNVNKERVRSMTQNKVRIEFRYPCYPRAELWEQRDRRKSRDG